MSPKVTLEHKQNVRESILDAAAQVFARQGYYEASMDEIVQEAKLSKGAVYAYFPSKEVLFFAVKNRETTTILDAIAKPTIAAKTLTEELSTALSASILRCVANPTSQACAVDLDFLAQAQRRQPLRAKFQERYGNTHKFITDFLRHGVKKSEFRSDLDIDSLASIILATIDGLSLHRALLDKEPDWNSIGETFGQTIANGINTTHQHMKDEDNKRR